MAGLDPAIQRATMNYFGADGVDARVKPGHDELCGVMGGWVYIVTNRRNGTLYVGVTGNLARRAWEHRTSAVDGFTSNYGLTRLVLAERHETVPLAIQREKNIKHWSRAWKIALIEASNPEWSDLYDLVSGA